MGSPIPEDPYVALGVAKDATTAAIKAQYRKLVLKCHPDKVQDESLKEAAADRFHRITTAYEILVDEDQRHRYDARCRLADLRRDVMERQGGAAGGRSAEVRTTAYKVPTDAARGGASSFYTRGPERTGKASPQYEERKPAYASAAYAGDGFDGPARSSTRKGSGAEFDRTPKRAAAPPPRDEREHARVFTRQSKDAERAKQRERSRRTDQEIRRDRDRKASVTPESDSDSDEYEHLPRRSRDAYYATQPPPSSSTRNYYDEERLHKLHSQFDGAREYQDRSRRRPSPVRMSSSPREHVKRDSARGSYFVRRPSGRPKNASRDTTDRYYSERTPPLERRSSTETDDDRRRPPPTKSAYLDPRPSYDPQQRSYSLQANPREKDDVPKPKRAETVPTQVPLSRERERESRRKESTAAAAAAAASSKGAGLRQADLVDEYTTSSPMPASAAAPAATATATATATAPDRSGAAPPKYHYQQEYADDHEYPTPDGYRTEIREPTSGATSSRPRFTRSPSPMRPSGRDREREKARGTSTRYAQPSPQRPSAGTRKTSYVYNPATGVEPRPPVSRENSGGSARRDDSLYGEIRPTAPRLPRQSSASKHSTYPGYPDGAYRRRPEDLPVQTGFGGARRPSVAVRPTYERSGGSRPIYVR